MSEPIEMPRIRIRRGDVLLVQVPGPISKKTAVAIKDHIVKAFTDAGARVAPPVVVTQDDLKFSVISQEK